MVYRDKDAFSVGYGIFFLPWSKFWQTSLHPDSVSWSMKTLLEKLLHTQFPKLHPLKDFQMVCFLICLILKQYWPMENFLMQF